MVGAALSLIIIGAGHGVLGRPWRGILWFAAASVMLMLTSVVPHAIFACAAIYVVTPIDVAMVSMPRDSAPPSTSRIIVYVASLMGALMVVRMVSMAFFVEAYRIPAGSMQPTLHIGDHIVASKVAYWRSGPARGDVVVFPHPCMPDKEFIKRVVAVAGDTVEMRCNILYINGRPVPQTLVAGPDACVSWDYDPSLSGDPWREAHCSEYSEAMGNAHYEVLYSPERPAADQRRDRTDAPVEYEHVAPYRDFPALFAGVVPELPGCESPLSGPDRPALGQFVESQPDAEAFVGKQGICIPVLSYRVPPGHVFVLGDNRDNSSDSRMWGPVPVADITGKATMIWWSRGPGGVVWNRLFRRIE